MKFIGHLHDFLLRRADALALRRSRLRDIRDGCRDLLCRLCRLVGILRELRREIGNFARRPLNLIDEDMQLVDGLLVSCGQLAELILRLHLDRHSQVPIRDFLRNPHEVLHRTLDRAREIERHRHGKHEHDDGQHEEQDLCILITVCCHIRLLLDEVLALIDDDAEIPVELLISGFAGGHFLERCIVLPRQDKFFKARTPLLVRAPFLPHFLKSIRLVSREHRLDVVERDVHLPCEAAHLLRGIDLPRERCRAHHRVFCLTVDGQRTVRLRKCKHVVQMFRCDAHRIAVDGVKRIACVDAHAREDGDQSSEHSIELLPDSQSVHA